MDLRATIRELYEEKQRLEEAIASLEQLLGAKGSPAARAPGESPKGRRGRKTMSPEERREVSTRMKRYWAKRRAEVAKASRGSGA